MQLVILWVIFATSGMMVWILCKFLPMYHYHSSRCSGTDKRPLKQVYPQVSATKSKAAVNAAVTHAFLTYASGNYSRLSCEIQFVRSMGYYLIQIYIPSSLIVVISWVSFWLNRGATPARVTLGVTTVLTMTSLTSSTNSQLPKISYMKSIDIYLSFCFIMVFASLIGESFH